MRDIKELLKTQEVISPTSNNTSSISHALQLHHEIDELRKETSSLKEENDKLKERNQSLIDGQVTYIDLIAELEKDLRSADEKNLRHQKKLEDELNALQVSWDSLYDDLRKVKKERDELRSKLDEVVSKGPVGVSAAGDDNTDGPLDQVSPLPRTPRERRRSASLRGSILQQLSLPMSPAPMPEEDSIEPIDQAALLRSSLQKHKSFTSAAFGMFSGHSSFSMMDDDRSVSSGIVTISGPIKSFMVDKKVNDLECENLKLKSMIVQLQAKLREEKYRNGGGGSNAKEQSKPLTTSSLHSPLSKSSLSSRRTMNLQTRSGTRRGIPARAQAPRISSLVEGKQQVLQQQQKQAKDRVPLVVMTSTDQQDQDGESSSSSSARSNVSSSAAAADNASHTSKDRDSTSTTDTVSSHSSEDGEEEGEYDAATVVVVNEEHCTPMVVESV